MKKVNSFLVVGLLVCSIASNNLYAKGETHLNHRNSIASLANQIGLASDNEKASSLISGIKIDLQGATAQLNEQQKELASAAIAELKAAGINDPTLGDIKIAIKKAQSKSQVQLALSDGASPGEAVGTAVGIIIGFIIVIVLFAVGGA